MNHSIFLFEILLQIIEKRDTESKYFECKSSEPPSTVDL